jgi:hypothetical protein
MSSPAIRRLSRLLGDPPGGQTGDREATVAELLQRVRTDPNAVVRGLVAEALASDDVTSVEGALAFISERLVELAVLLPDDLRAAIALQAEVEVRRRVPGHARE